MGMAEGPAVARRTVLRGAALGTAGALAGPAFWRQAMAAGAPPARAPHLAFGANPSHAMTLSWSTAQSVAGAVVEIGPTAALGMSVPVETVGYRHTPTRYHHARATGLTPNTTYHWRLAHNGATPKTGTFHTAPAAGQPLRFVALGDMGVSEGGAENVRRISNLNPAPTFTFHVGDLCYASLHGGIIPLVGTDQAVWDDWLVEIAPVASRSPWMTAVGNHEMEPDGGELGYDGYFTRMAMPHNGAPGARSTWAVRVGSVGLIALDANDTSSEIAKNTGYSGGAQDRWLRTTLASMRADPTIDFIVAGFHHCAYCSNLLHSSDGGVRKHWGKLFDEFKVDLVINGHNHSYERTCPVRGGKPIVEAPKGATVEAAKHGTTYVTAGGGGQTPYPLGVPPLAYVNVSPVLKVPELATWSAVHYLNLGYVVLDVTPADANRIARMKLTAYSVFGDQIDRVTMIRRRPA
jgi:hypothetical protein